MQLALKLCLRQNDCHPSSLSLTLHDKIVTTSLSAKVNKLDLNGSYLLQMSVELLKHREKLLLKVPSFEGTDSTFVERYLESGPT